MKEIETDKFDKLGDLLSALSTQGKPQKKDESYKLTFEDVKRLHDVYCALETEIKGTEKKTGAEYLKEIDTYLISALKYEAWKISKKRNLEYVQYEAQLEAKGREETPRKWRDWRRFFRLTSNRAQIIVDDEAALNADYMHHLQEIKLDELERDLENIEVGATAGGSLPLRKRRKLRNKIKKHERAMKRLKKKLCVAEPEPGESGDVQNAAPATAPAPMREPERKEKAKNRVKKPVSVIEQLPGQMNIENITAQQ